MIYFVRAASGEGAIKIGTTSRLTERLKQLEQRQGVPLQVLGVLDGSFAEERAIHAKFGHLLQRDEWFGAHTELTDFIEVECRPWDGKEEACRRAVVVVIKGSAEWKAWVEDGARYCRLSVSTLADLALAAFLKTQGFNKEPPER